MQTLNTKSFLLGVAFTVCVLGLTSWNPQHYAPFAAVSSDRMNVLYVGVDNPITAITSEGVVDSSDISLSGGNITGHRGNFIATVTRVDDCRILIKKNGKEQQFSFRVIQIPDPVMCLGGGPNRKGGSMSAAEFKAQTGLVAVLESLGFDAKCSVTSFNLLRDNRENDPEIAANEGGRYSAATLILVNKAKANDRYYFTEIKARCPGDQASRILNNLSFVIR